ncbi:MAG: hypothetical protein CSA96_00550 [Bacteroidetes bacterium]|nr:MAG: hypothetical protein CSA96_00550 [Bacteroidota bacterium]
MKKDLHNKDLSKLLARYGATALAAAVGTTASGQILHTPEVNDTIHLGDTLQVDFDGDEYADVEFSISLNPRHIDKTWGDFIFTQALATPGGKGLGAYWYWGSYMNPLELDQMIAGDTSFTFMNNAKEPSLDTAMMYSKMGTLSHMGWTTWGIYGWGLTAEDSSAYLGYEFRIEEEPHYAWVRVTFHRTNEFPGKNNYGGDNLYLVINEYAYETSGAGIKAGAISPGVGVEDRLSEAFTLYPNPARNLVSIRMQGSSKYELSVFDLTGKQVLSTQFEGREYSLDIAELNSGIYMLYVSDGDRRLCNKLLVQ